MAAPSERFRDVDARFEVAEPATGWDRWSYRRFLWTPRRRFHRCRRRPGQRRIAPEEGENMSDDQVALVTGATGTIGRAIAAELGARGASLVLTGRRAQVLIDVADELRDRGVRVQVAVGDVTDPAHAEQAVARADEVFGPVTTLVNNAGGASSFGTSVVDSDPLAWRETLLTNAYGPYLFARAVPPAMLRRKQGRIITVASRAGTAPVPSA